MLKPLEKKYLNVTFLKLNYLSCLNFIEFDCPSITCVLPSLTFHLSLLVKNVEL